MIRRRHPYHNLRILFAQREITQTEAAAMAGISPSAMSARMSGKQPFTAREMDALGERLNIPRAGYYMYFFPELMPRPEDEVQP